MSGEDAFVRNGNGGTLALVSRDIHVTMMKRILIGSVA